MIKGRGESVAKGRGESVVVVDGGILDSLRLPFTRAADRTRGARGKILFGAPMMSLFSNSRTKNRWTVLQNVENTYKRGL